MPDDRQRSSRATMRLRPSSMVEFRANPGKRSFVDHLLGLGDAVIEIDCNVAPFTRSLGFQAQSSFISLALRVARE
jgi:hypothetical protein